jgi:outer membrane lipopolysaccharide assembly protein LptE/RlpB
VVGVAVDRSWMFSSPLQGRGQGEGSPLSRSPSRSWAPLFLLLSACGYHMTASGGPLPKNLTSVYVPEFENRTAETGVGGSLTDEVRRLLDRQGIGAQADPKGNEGTLYGRILNAGASPLASKVYNSNMPGVVTNPNAVGDPGLYVVSLTVSARLMRGDEVVSEIQNLSLSEQYLPANDLAAFEANRQNALHRLVREMAKEIVERLTTGF